MKKILYLVTKSNMGGAQRYVFDLATHLPKTEYEVVVAFGGNGALKEALEKAGIHTQTISSFERDVHIGKEFRSWIELWKLIQKERPSVIHLNSSKAGGSGALIARLLGVPTIIFTAHGWPFFENRNVVWKTAVWFFSYLTVLLSTRTVVVSEHDVHHALMFRMKHKLVLVRNAVPAIEYFEQGEARARLPLGDAPAEHASDLWVVSTGEHTANKNLFTLLDAVRIHNSTEQKKLFLTLMSDGEERADLEKYVVAYKMETQVIFTGFVENVPQYLKAFDIFVIPSRKEGLPYGLLEAGSAGLACIGSNVGGIPEIIDDGINGLLVNPHETDSLVRALAMLARDPSLRIAYGTALKEKITHTFNADTMLAKTIELYD